MGRLGAAKEVVAIAGEIAGTRTSAFYCFHTPSTAMLRERLVESCWALLYQEWHRMRLRAGSAAHLGSQETRQISILAISISSLWILLIWPTLISV